jgi:hypothetical protein
MIEMHFYITKTRDGLYHIQNAISGVLGQHHVHTKTGYEKWKKEIPKERLHIEEGKVCCDLKAGEVKDHRGNVTVNKLFL